MINLVIFASGTGTNTENIIRHFANDVSICVTAVFSNKKDAPVLEKTHNLGISSYYFSNKQFSESSDVLQTLLELKTDAICLAGFLYKIPYSILKAFPNRIFNIHPSLLPKYGGKGMYGLHVHEAVINNHEKESGITIHLIDEQYDKGCILFQKSCAVFETDTPHLLAQRVHKLEYEFYPKIIKAYLSHL